MATPRQAGSEAMGEGAAMLDAWRARGDHRFDPVRFRFMEALARRSEPHEGETRRILDERLAKLLAAYEEDLAQARRAEGETGRAEQDAPRSALAELVDHIARHAPAHEDGPPPGDGVPGLSAAPELKTLRYFKSTWTRLSTDRRLAQSLAKVPEQAGPLNTEQLVHRMLTLMREQSPGYLDRFMGYVDTLSWLQTQQVGGLPVSVKASARAAAAPTKAARAEGPKKTSRGRPR
jgi:hypothetical protein